MADERVQERVRLRQVAEEVESVALGDLRPVPLAHRQVEITGRAALADDHQILRPVMSKLGYIEKIRRDAAEERARSVFIVKAWYNSIRKNVQF